MIDSGSIWIGEQIIDGNIDLDWPGDVANRTTLRALQNLIVWLLAGLQRAFRIPCKGNG